MKKLFRDNPLIAVSVALPLLVVLLFAAASVLPRLFVEAPAHDLLLSYNSYDNTQSIPVRINLSIEGQRVVARIGQLKQHEQAYLPRLFRYDHQTQQAREIHIPLPAHLDELEDGAEFSIPDLADVKVTSTLESPDGYEFRGHQTGRGLMMELFGGRRSNSVAVHKNGAVIRIRLPAPDYWYNGVRFLGWVI